jgi:hypothetical protein
MAIFLLSYHRVLESTMTGVQKMIVSSFKAIAEYCDAAQ